MEQETRGFRPEEPTRRVEPKRAFDLPSTLAYLLTPVLPLLKRIRVTREGPRGHGS